MANLQLVRFFFIEFALRIQQTLPVKLLPAEIGQTPSDQFKVDELMALVDQVEAQITASRAMAEKLMTAVVAELTAQV